MHQQMSIPVCRPISPLSSLSSLTAFAHSRPPVFLLPPLPSSSAAPRQAVRCARTGPMPNSSRFLPRPLFPHARTHQLDACECMRPIPVSSRALCTPPLDPLLPLTILRSSSHYHPNVVICNLPPPRLSLSLRGPSTGFPPAPWILAATTPIRLYHSPATTPAMLRGPYQPSLWGSPATCVRAQYDIAVPRLPCTL